MEKFGCLGLLVILLGLLVVWGTILNIPNAGECALIFELAFFDPRF